MAIVVIDQASGVTAEQWEALRRKFNESANPPSGQKALLAGPIEGGWRVISVWESQDAYETFRRDQLTPVLQQMGIADHHHLEVSPLHTVMFAPQQH